MASVLEKRVAYLWDALMPEERWVRWEDPTDDVKNPEDYCSDVMMLATDISRDAFELGVEWARRNPGSSYRQMEDAMHKQYPKFPKVTKWRTSKTDSNGNCWQVRDGMAWCRLPKSTIFNKHTDVKRVLEAMSRLEQYDDVALLANLAANPTE